MKTIEEAFDEWSKTCISALWGKSASEFKSAFNAGAEYALANQWISAEDRLPEDEELVLINHKDGDTMLAVWNERHQCWDDEYGDDVMYSDGVSHWMPIPELKNQEQ